MIENYINVRFPYYYDFVYRINNANLKFESYSIDFLDWIKAGIAYNTGVNDPTRKISNFVKFYKAINSSVEDDYQNELLRTAVLYFYEDIFQLYQQYLVAHLKIRYGGKKDKSPEPNGIIIVPVFELCSDRLNSFRINRINPLHYYSVFASDFKDSLATAYVTNDTLLFHYMSLYFDYGCKKLGNGVLLEVI